jgi:alkylation response protein AidB-like acyl-CoA dehydrogenase
MKFDLTEEQRTIRDAAKTFAENELLPGVIDRDRKMLFPDQEVKRMGELGFLGMIVDPEFGGSGLDMTSYILVIEEIAKVDPSCAVILSVNNSLVCKCIEDFGSEIQKKKYLPILASGEKIGAFCLSEPGAGSDASQLKTSVSEHENYYLLNGTKNWITNGSSSGIHIVFAQVNPEKRHKGIECFIVESDWKGVEIGPKEDKLGIRASDTNSIIYTNAEIPKENRMGEQGEGFNIAMKTLIGGRVGIAAQALGIVEAAHSLARQYAMQRTAFGKPIIEHQIISFKLAEMATDIEAARLLVLKACQLYDSDKDCEMVCSMAKLFASDVAMKHTLEAIQIHGGYGYVKEYHVERLMRDAKITQIYEGTSEIQRIIIARKIMKRMLYAW